MRSCELLIEHAESLDLSNVKAMPTVCLLVLPLQLDRIELEKLVCDCLSAGVVFFAIWGERSDDIEDEIDFILEGAGDSQVHVPTTSHSDESAEDTANFVVNGAYLDDGHFRVLAVVGDGDYEREDLVAFLRKRCGELGAVSANGQPQ